MVSCRYSLKKSTAHLFSPGQNPGALSARCLIVLAAAGLKGAQGGDELEPPWRLQWEMVRMYGGCMVDVPVR